MKIAAGSRPWLIAIGLVLVAIFAVIVFGNRGLKGTESTKAQIEKVRPSEVVTRDMNFSPKARPPKVPATAFPVVRGTTVQVVQPLPQTFPEVIKPVTLPVTVTSVAVPSVQPSTIKKGSYKIY